MALADEPDAGRVRALAALLPAQPVGLGRPITDRPAWEGLAQHAEFRNLPAAAQQLVQEGLPAQPAELFLDFSRTGNRDRWQKVASARRGRVKTLTLAECVENRGRFLRPLEETLEALCAEPTWVMPAHDADLRSFKGQTVGTDLGSTMLGWEVATADWLLGDRLSPGARQLIRTHLERRVFAPVRAMLAGRQPEAFWLRATHNWNAVCLAGTVGAALAVLEPPEERAWFVALAEQRIGSFLSGFSPDGYCSEGMGYWNYGFGHFVLLSETLRQATGGKLDLLARPAAHMPARFGLRAEILNGVYPSIADCQPGTQPDGQLMRYLCARLQLPDPRWTALPPGSARHSLAGCALYSFLPEKLPLISGTNHLAPDRLRTWFADGGVLICRPAPGGPPFAACLKGGHNAEHHNHNDVGSFAVVCGKTQVLCDPGGEVYTARTFSPRRYESPVLNSYGHSVPVVAGQLQRTGPDAQAVVKRADFTDAEDRLELDLRAAYAVPELTRLDRQFLFRRHQPVRLVVRDDVAFRQPASFETALLSGSQGRQTGPREWVFGQNDEALHVQVDTGEQPFTVQVETLDADVQTPTKPVRTAFRLNTPVARATVTLTIQPHTLR